MRTSISLALGAAALSCLPMLAGCGHTENDTGSATTSTAPSTKAAQVTTPTHTKSKNKNKPTTTTAPDDADAPSPTSDEPSPSDEPTTSGKPSSSSWTMPDVKGKNLLQAKLDIRDLVGDISRPIKTKDLTDQDRRPRLDLDWQVCNSTPAAGESFTSDTTIELGIVRKSETCPGQQ